MKYTALTDDEKLMIARDRLRDMEADHFRLSISADGADSSRITKLEEKIISTQAAIEELTGQQTVDTDSV